MSKELPSFSNGSEALNYAHQHRMEHQPGLAIPAFREAARLFGEKGDRRRAMRASSWHLTLRGRLGKKEVKYEQDLSHFLEEYKDFFNEKGYLFCEQIYLTQISIRSYQQENYLTAVATLQKLVDLVESHRDVFDKVPKEQIAIWRAQAKIAALKNTQDIDKRIQYYREAANLSSSHEGMDSALADKMRVCKANYLSAVEKLLAFRCVRRGRNDLDGAITHMRQAIEYAQAAKQIAPEKFALHPHYLSYWLNMYFARKRVEDRDFQEALQYLDKTIIEASNFIERSIFPNYFANKLDLCQERRLVEAYIAFSEKRFGHVSTLLNAWLKAMKEDLQGSWKYTNVAVRKVVTNVLLKGLLPPPADKVKKNIDEASGSVRVGTACHKLADLVMHAATTAERGLLTSESYEEIIKQCISSFPLSSQSSDYQVSIGFFERNPYDELPAYFGEWIKEAEQLDGEVLFDELELGLRVYLTVICDYYDQKWDALVQRGVEVKPLPVGFTRDFINMDIGGLAIAVIHLLKSIGKMPKGRPNLVTEFRQWLNDYLQLRSQFLGNCDSKVAKQMFQLIKQKLIGQTYIEIFPLVIRVVSYAVPENDVREYHSQVLWQRPGVEEMILRGKMVFEVGKYYYLKPHWKNLYHVIQDTSHLTFEAYESSLFEKYVLTEHEKHRDRRRIRGFQWRCFEFPSKIKEFEKIISNPGREYKIEQFLLENKWMLSPYYIEIKVEKRIQEDFRLDLFCTRDDERHDIWEIKLPSKRLFKSDFTKTSEFNAALDQLGDYQRVMKENAQRIFWQTQMRIYEPSGFLLIGREEGPKQQEYLRRLNDELSRLKRTVLTYDDLIGRAKNFIETLRGQRQWPATSYNIIQGK